jgi:hypothetical protein
MNAQHTPMVVSAARAMNKRMADQCNVDADDQWKLYGDDMLSDAKAILDAAGATDLLAAAVKTVDENGHLADGDNCTLIHLVRAISKANGGAE